MLRKLVKHWIFLGMGLGLLFWTLDSAIDAFLLREHAFAEQLFTPSRTEVYYRLAIGGLLTLLVRLQFEATQTQGSKKALGETVQLNVPVRDITERKHMEHKVLEAEKRFDMIFKHSNDAIFLIDPKQNAILEANPMACRMLGFAREELVSKQIVDIHPEGLTALQDFIQSVFEKKEGWTDAFTCRMKDGKRLSTEISASVIHFQGRTCILELVCDISERKDAEKSIQYMAYYDRLTGLPNRAYFIEHLEKTILLEQDKDKRIAFFLLNLIHLKDVNDSFGLDYADLLLKNVGQHLREMVGPPSMVARLGGDEFGLVLTLSDMEEITLTVRKILKLFEEPLNIGDLPLYIEASVGIVISPDHGSNANSLFQKADVALHEAKQSGCSFVIYRPPSKKKPSLQSTSLMGELHQAVNNHQLRLYYQPKINLLTGKISGVEALVRWQHPKRGMVLPDQFIVPAERTGLIKPLTRWVLNEALRQCHRWGQSRKKVVVSVNLAIRNIQDPQLPDQIEAFIQKYDISPSSLEVEVTEGTIMTDEMRAIEVLNKLREKGISISIDDFGKGYSSLTYLRKLSARTIKIDKSFVRNMMVNKDDAVIVRSTIDLGHNLGLKVTAEGVEDREILDRLNDLGCDEAQGFYIARPFPPSAFEKQLDEMKKRGGWTLPS